MSPVFASHPGRRRIIPPVLLLWSLLLPCMSLEDWTECFHLSESRCPEKGCKCAGVDGESVLCCHLESDSELEKELRCASITLSNVTRLHIRNWTVEELNATENRWNSLKSLAVTDSKVRRIRGRFSDNASLKCLNMSNNNLSQIHNGSLDLLTDLRFLDLSENKLSSLPRVNLRNDSHLDISGNHLVCSKVIQQLEALENLTRFRNRNLTLCAGVWPADEKFPVFDLLEAQKMIQIQCPQGKDFWCKCERGSIHYQENSSTGWQIVARVDCSRQGLKELPLSMPNNTAYLDVSHNNISDLSPLATNPAYRGVLEFVGDYNNISSIQPLEGSVFIKRFNRLSLKYNNIKTLHTFRHILTKVFDKEKHVQSVLLGWNHLKCDCDAVHVTKPWINKYREYLKNHTEILCVDTEEPVIELDPNTVCTGYVVWTDYIYYIIGAEAGLLLLLIIKVSYDYWVFKSSGYLPWPASRIPKLPCDCVFET